MIEATTVLLLGATPDREQTVRAALRDVATVRADRSLGVARSVAAGFRIALVDLVGDAAAGLGAIEELLRNHAGLPVIALAAVKDPDLILQAMRSGAREFVVPTEPGELARVVSDAARKLSGEGESGRILTLFSAKGGLGATTLATNLAGALGDDGKRVVLVDLDLQLGDVLVFLDAASRYTLADVLHNLKRLDRDLLHSSLMRHASGVFLLAQSDHLEDADKVTPAQIPTLLKFLARHFDYVVCDGLRSFDELALAVLDVSDKVLLVVTQDVPSVKNAQRCLDVMRRLGYGDDKLKLVVNRHQKSEIDVQSIADNLGVPVQAAVANDYQTVVKAINRGRLVRDVSPRARVVEDLARMARLIGGAPATRERRNGGFLRGLFARGAAEKRAQVEESDYESIEVRNEPERAPEAV
jgi:pilus assembly protein CpaE